MKLLPAAPNKKEGAAPFLRCPLLLIPLYFAMRPLLFPIGLDDFE